MRRDDRRHGTYAGFQAHRAEGKRPCAACREARNTYTKKFRSETTDWREQQNARQRALWKLADQYPDDFRRHYVAEMKAARIARLEGGQSA